MAQGSTGSIIGKSLLGYWAGKKAQERQGEIAGTAAGLADPWAPMRSYYQGILGEMYGMPEGYTDRPPESTEPTNELEKLLAKASGIFGGGPEAQGGIFGGMMGGPGGAATGGLLGGLLG